VVDSLPLLRFEVAPLDSGITHLLNQARDAVLQIGSVTDSLQNALDEMAVRWILDGSVTGRTGAQYGAMIEALAYAYSSLDFADTAATTVSVTIPSEIEANLQKNGTLESYKTFVRVCSDRYAMHLALFPVDFLPNLRKDTASFPLPFYLMLKTVSDYYAGNLALCKDQITGIFRTCSGSGFLSRFDRMRVNIDWRLNRVPANVLRLLDEGKELQASDDYASAGDKYRQAMIIAPDFAYAAYTSGEFYEENGDSALALGMFQKAYQLDTLYLSAYLHAYRLYRAQDNYRSMIAVMTLALTHGNDFWVTNYSLGKALMAADEPARAVDRFRRAQELNPQSYETCIELGKAYQATRDFAKAREYFNKAIEIDALRKEAVDALSDLNDQERKAH
jgi:Flp pilus assembly protein TadD